MERESATFEKIVLVTRKTRLAELIERFNSLAQARFYIERASGNFAEYQAEDDAYHRSAEVVRKSIDLGLKVQQIDRSLVPTFTFLPRDIVITLGQDGLVANTAKYVAAQPIIAVNPDPQRFDGILLPFLPGEARNIVEAVIASKCRIKKITLAQATLGDGQRLLAFNDLFLGPQTHVSARYRVHWHEVSEDQSSSGILVSTGAGSTGWVSSAFNMAAGIAAFSGASAFKPIRMSWEDPRLLFVVREPFISRHSSANIVAGIIEREKTLTIESLMPSGGVIFSDGIESDYMQFNSGAKVVISVAKESAHLAVK